MLRGFLMNINRGHAEKPAGTAALPLRLEEKQWGRVENTPVGLTAKRSNWFAFSPLFSFSFELSQSSHLM